MDVLNEQQKQAVEAGDGPVLIIAGPGTGKTKTLTARIAYLIKSGQAKPHEILALTFTKKAAQEMANRVGAKGPSIATFHALCHSILGGDYSFATEPERHSMIKALPRPSALRGAAVRDIGLMISCVKNMAQPADGLEALVAAYNTALQQKGLIDFDDLLVKARDFLRDSPAKRPYFTHILVDEFQDTNLLQYELLQLLCHNDNLFVIGDPHQSIYSFRGANSSIFDRFKQDFKAYAQVELTVNYRSAAPVVHLANAIFKDTPLHAHQKGSGNVQAMQFLNEYSEAHWIVGQIQAAIGGADLLQAGTHDATHSFKDFAILYRSRRVAHTVQKYIEDSGLPYQVVGEGSPYEQPDAVLLVALLRCCVDTAARVPNMTNAQAQAVVKKVDTTKPPADVARALLQAIGITPSKALTQIINSFVRFGSVGEVVAHINVIADQSYYDPAADAITLLTIHASKGLEFTHVVLVAAEEGVLPSEKADEAEERRLFYVAATRAKEKLDVTYGTKRGGKPAKPSRLITGLPDAVLPKVRDPNLAADARRLQKRQAKRAQTSLF